MKKKLGLIIICLIIIGIVLSIVGCNANTDEDAQTGSNGVVMSASILSDSLYLYQPNAKVTEDIPYDLLYACRDNDNYYYGFDLGTVKNVLVDDNPYTIRYMGPANIKRTYTTSKVTSTSIENQSSWLEQRLEYDNKLAGESGSAEVGGLFGLFSAKASGSRQYYSNTTTTTNSSGETVKQEVTVTESQSIEITFDSTCPYGDYRISHVMNYDVFVIATKAIKTGEITLNLMTLPRKGIIELYEYSDNGFSDIKLPELDFDSSIINGLPVPTDYIKGGDELPPQFNDVNFGDGVDYTYIYSVEDFLEKIPKKLNGNFVIMYDLDFEGATLPSFGKFSGILRGYVNDGKKPVLKNFTLSSTNQQYLGLFPELASGGIIRDIDAVNCSITFSSDNKNYSEGSLGIFAGISYGLIDNCSVQNSTFNGYIYKFVGTSDAVKLHCGAITGWNAGGTITNCSSSNNQFVGSSNGGKTDGKVECNVGGITGMNTGKGLINKCDSYTLSISITLRGGKTWTFTNVRMKGRAGGIVGYNGTDASVLNCTASSNISNYSFTLTKAESCNYNNLTSKGAFIGLNDGNSSGNTAR